jgi:hypothetical protein
MIFSFLAKNGLECVVFHMEISHADANEKWVVFKFEYICLRLFYLYDSWEDSFQHITYTQAQFYD